MKIINKFILLFLINIFFTNVFFARVFFAGKIREAILGLIENEKRCIKVAMYIFTDPVIASALVKAHHNGIRVECVIDALAHRAYRGQGNYLRDNDVMVMQYLQKHERDLMHSKYLIFDKTKLYKKEAYFSCVITGSYNCSQNAAYNNHENMVIIFDQEVVNQYHKNFCKIKRDSEFISIHKVRKR